MALWQLKSDGSSLDDHGTAGPGEENFVSQDLAHYNYLGRSPAAETPQAKDLRESQERDQAAQTQEDEAAKADESGANVG